MAINRDLNRVDLDIRKRALDSLYPWVFRCNGQVWLVKSSSATPEDFAKALHAAAWCEGETVGGIVNGRRLRVRPRARVSQLVEAVEALER